MKIQIVNSRPRSRGIFPVVSTRARTLNRKMVKTMMWVKKGEKKVSTSCRSGMTVVCIGVNESGGFGRCSAYA